MNRFLPLLFVVGFFLTLSTSTAQDYRVWGTTVEEGEGYGSIFSFRPEDSQMVIPKYFSGSDNGSSPFSITEAPNGWLYGVNYDDGTNRSGTIFKVQPDGSAFTLLHKFSGTDGKHPRGALLNGNDDYLYGVTLEGGASNKGVIYRIKYVGGGFQKLFDFNGTNGASPLDGLIEASDGKLYGVTYQGGTSGHGVLFRINKDGTGFSKVVDFDGLARRPVGELAEGIDGKLYGVTMTFAAGPDGGIAYSVNKDGTDFLKLWDFNGGANGSRPTGIKRGIDGKFYGMAMSGTSPWGMIFSIERSGGVTNFVSLYDMSEATGQPGSGNLNITSTGDLIGVTTYGGGAHEMGILFKAKADGTQFQSLLDFNTNLGQSPNYVMQGSDGSFYGTATLGGASGNGVVFNVSIVGIYSKLLEFPSSSNTVTSSPIKGSDNILYGMSNSGGAHGYGTIYKINRDGTRFEVLHDFTLELTGGFPAGGLLEGTDGYLYGTTEYGGANNQGVIFKINRNGDGCIILKEFSTEDGTLPRGSLIQIHTGEIVGTTYAGGANLSGTIFKINMDGSGFTRLFEFDSDTGVGPTEIMQGQDQFLYGINSAVGGSGHGYLYRIEPDGSNYTKVFHFNATTTGLLPNGGLVQSPDGELFGTTRGGGNLGRGILFKVQPNGTNFLRLHDFMITDGQYPEKGQLAISPDGYVFGTTQGGGANSRGTLFKIKTDGTDFTKLYDFTEASGSFPYTTNVLLVATEPQTITLDPIQDKVFGDGGPFGIAVSTTSGLPITLVSSNNKITLNGNSMTINSPGTVTITASQDGNLLFSKAQPKQQTFCILPATPGIIQQGNILTSSADTGNQWSKDGVPIAGATEKTYTITETGNYWVRVTIDGCTSLISNIKEVTCVHPPQPAVTVEGFSTLISSSATGNQWYLNDEPIVGATGNTYQASESGTYHVRVGSASCNTDSEPVMLVITGIENPTSGIISLFPNPAYTDLNVSLDIPGHQPLKGEIFDLTGRRMGETLIRSEGVVLDVKHYTRGSYVIRITNDHTVYVKKFIKQ